MPSTDPLEAAKNAVAALDTEALGRFAGWFGDFHAKAWDAQMERDFSDPATLHRFIGERQLQALIRAEMAKQEQAQPDKGDEPDPAQ
ncbi:hypothetical protein [Herbaspirillum sp.]|uniref:hypothetical protein n=1 Tax=Herbaspirillum sp. TaxID=1890675 RepID=UPI0031D264FC